MTEEINIHELTRKQLLQIKSSHRSAILRERAADELQRRDDKMKFVRSFLFPNLWAIISIFFTYFSLHPK
jgi:hypothetical protein